VLPILPVRSLAMRSAFFPLAGLDSLKIANAQRQPLIGLHAHVVPESLVTAPDSAGVPRERRHDGNFRKQPCLTPCRLSGETRRWHYAVDFISG
jgi:hypothetical protein